MPDLSSFLTPAILYIAQTTLTFILLAAMFVGVTRLFPGKPDQPVLRRDMPTDAIYFFGAFVYSFISIYAADFLQPWVYSQNDVAQLRSEGLPPVSSLPAWLQFVMLVFMVDFLQYWIHRLTHREPLWKFHAIHHSSQTVDWLSAVRWHPLNAVFYITLLVELVLLLGFNPKVVAVYVALYAFNGYLVHANLNWTYGPLRYVFASPVFHRWHHTEEGGNKNFAPYLSFLDLIFGTFYMPKGERPTNFGVKHDPVPESFLGQLAYPFRKRT